MSIVTAHSHDGRNQATAVRIPGPRHDPCVLRPRQRSPGPDCRQTRQHQGNSEYRHSNDCYLGRALPVIRLSGPVIVDGALAME